MKKPVKKLTKAPSEVQIKLEFLEKAHGLVDMPPRGRNEWVLIPRPWKRSTPDGREVEISREEFIAAVERSRISLDEYMKWSDAKEAARDMSDLGGIGIVYVAKLVDTFTVTTQDAFEAGRSIWHTMKRRVA